MKFDLRYEPWIPVRDKSNQIREVGIIDLLCKSTDLLEITDEFPHQEFGMYRLMMALLMDIYRPRKLSCLEELLEDGEFDKSLIRNYFDNCEREGVSFDLFDEKRPFYQVPITDWDTGKELSTVALLNPTLPSGNNHIHFNHGKETDTEFTYAEAARALCSLSVFCTAGAQGYPSTVNGAPPIYSIVKGKNLFRTLVFGMVASNQYDNYANEPVLWRWKQKIEEKKEIIDISLLSGLTFPCRRVTLLPENNGTVKKMYFGQGMNFTGYTTFIDPYVGYLQTEKGRSNIKPSVHVEPWRNIANLVDCDKKTAPLVIQQYKDLTDKDVIQINTYSVVTSNASYLDEFEGEYLLPISILKSNIKMGCLQSAIEECEKQGRTLEFSLKQLKSLLGYGKDEKNLNGQIRNTVSQYFSESRDILFQNFIEQLTLQDVLQEDILKEWKGNVWKTSINKYDDFVERLGSDANLLLCAEKNRENCFFGKVEVKQKND